MSIEQKQVQNYILGIISIQFRERTLGKGTFGKVKLGYHTVAEEYVAVKILEKCRIESHADLTRVKREISILRKLQHPNIIQLYEILESDQVLYLVMEYARGGELFDFIVKKTKLQESLAARYLMQLIAGVEYMHQKKVVHRDLKPENLLLDDNRNIKIVDFGLSNTYQNDGQLLTACGSPCYAAPEMLYGKPYSGRTSDLWSCGIILFAMLCGFLPFEHENTKQLYEMIKKEDFEKPNHLSSSSIDLLSRLLTKDPVKRIGFDGVRQHPFCQRISYIPMTQTINLRDAITLKKMADMGYEIEVVQENLDSGKHNQITAIYHLLMRKNKSPSIKVTMKKPFLETFNTQKFKLDLRSKHQQYMLQLEEKPLQVKQSSTGGSASKECLKKVKDNSKLKSLQSSIQARMLETRQQRQKTQSVHDKSYFPSPDKYSVLRKDSNKAMQLFKKKNTTDDVQISNQTEINDYQFKKQLNIKEFPVKIRNRTQPMKSVMDGSVDDQQSTKPLSYSVHQSPYNNYQRRVSYKTNYQGIKIRHNSQQNNVIRVQKLLSHNFV
ncbi:hypothetical protein pb186bvf_018415 [Paramecium bursaria]